jgi:hypothetical protein
MFSKKNAAKKMAKRMIKSNGKDLQKVVKRKYKDLTKDVSRKISSFKLPTKGSIFG